MNRRLIVCLVLSLLTVLPAPAADKKSAAADLVLIQRGALPIILTSPHGGLSAVPGAEERSPVGNRFVAEPDTRSDLLTLGIAAELQKLTGKKPYIVLAKFHRKYIDANRKASEAYSSPAAKPVYDYYHAHIRQFIDEVKKQHPHGMLFDIHGQSAFPDSVLRGTRNGTTVKALLARAGAPALTGPNSVFGQFQKLGYQFIPANHTDPTAKVEAEKYTGAWTMEHYGSQNPDGIDAMQLEFGRDYRNKDRVDQTGKDAAKAIAAFYESYLKVNKPARKSESE